MWGQRSPPPGFAVRYDWKSCFSRQLHADGCVREGMIVSRWGFSRRWVLHAILVGSLLAGAGALVVYLTLGSRPLRVPAVSGPSAGPGGPESAPEPVLQVQEPAPAPGAEPAAVTAGTPDGSEPDRAWIEQAAAAASKDLHAGSALAASLSPLGYTIRGRVLSKDGPVRGDPNQWPPSRVFVQVSAPGYLRRCELDERGGFECSGLGEGLYTVSAVGRVLSGGYMSRRLFCSPAEVHLDQWRSTAEVVLVAGPTVPLCAVVTEEQTGRPVHGRGVCAAPVDGLSLESAITDDQGCCTLNLFPGRYRVYATGTELGESAARLVVVPPSANSAVVSLEIPAAKRKVIRVVLVDPQGSRIAGYVDISGVEWDPNVQQPADSFHAPVPDYK
jgi:hypothetical protein